MNDYTRYENLRGTILPSGRLVKQFYNTKTIKYGKYIEHTRYKSPRLLFSETQPRNRTARNEDENSERAERSIIRTRKKVRQLVACNLTAWGHKPIFFTLTYRENMQDLRESNAEFKKFIRRLRCFLGYSPKYLVVVEFQKRGAVHYHGILFNCPYISIPDFKTLWNLGSVDLKLVRNNLEWYLVKYLTKETFDKRLYGEKVYFCSRGLFRPTEHYAFDKTIQADNMDIVYSKKSDDINKIILKHNE